MERAGVLVVGMENLSDLPLTDLEISVKVVPVVGGRQLAADIDWRK